MLSVLLIQLFIYGVLALVFRNDALHLSYGLHIVELIRKVFIRMHQEGYDAAGNQIIDIVFFADIHQQEKIPEEPFIIDRIITKEADLGDGFIMAFCLEGKILFTVSADEIVYRRYKR